MDYFELKVACLWTKEFYRMVCGKSEKYFWFLKKKETILGLVRSNIGSLLIKIFGIPTRNPDAISINRN